MTEQKYSLKPISKQELENLKKFRKGIYTSLIEQFLESDDEAVEFVIPKDVPMKRPYQALISYARIRKFPFVVRRRQNRIFLLKVNKKECSKK